MPRARRRGASGGRRCPPRRPRSRPRAAPARRGGRSSPASSLPWWATLSTSTGPASMRRRLGLRVAGQQHRRSAASAPRRTSEQAFGSVARRRARASRRRPQHVEPQRAGAQRAARGDSRSAARPAPGRARHRRTGARVGQATPTGSRRGPRRGRPHGRGSSWVTDDRGEPAPPRRSASCVGEPGSRAGRASTSTGPPPAGSSRIASPWPTSRTVISSRSGRAGPRPLRAPGRARPARAPASPASPRDAPVAGDSTAAAPARRPATQPSRSRPQAAYAGRRVPGTDSRTAALAQSG